MVSDKEMDILIEDIKILKTLKKGIEKDKLIDKIGNMFLRLEQEGLDDNNLIS